MTSQPTALEGLKVLDFTHALAGPYCTLLLADYGATVYKLESPGGGYMGRGWGPPFCGSYASFFLGLNRSKQGISIDLKRPEGLDLCSKLIDQMDVLVENFRPGSMDRLGLGFDAMHARNPRLVYCSISGYGQNGPARDEAAMDTVVECSSGFLSITGTEEGELTRAGYAVCDVNAGLFATIGILMALRSRGVTGRGQYVDVSMFDGMISAMSSNYMTFLGSGEIPGPLGSGFKTIAPYCVYRAQDRSFGIAIGSEKLWATFCEVIGRPDLRSHADYATNPARVLNRRALDRLLGELFARAPMSHWVETLRAAGIPCSPVQNFAEVAEHAQSKVREMFPVIEHPTAGPQRVIGPPIKFSETPGRVTAPAPLLGEHTRVVLSEVLRMDEAAISGLVDRGVVFEPEPSAHSS
jgi:crotonobetainyl-CoA:carnitine CoA-transferase CaiB-like acyl-CoA transferase